MKKLKTIIRYFLFILLPSSFILVCSGCNIFAVAAQALPPATLAPAYGNLENQTVAVMVWADRGVLIDFNNIQLDVATALQAKLEKAPPKLLKNASFPLKPASVVRFQKDHPELEGAPIADIAPKLGVSRLIYIEIEEFATRAEQSLDLYRGSLAATIQVVEVEGGSAKVAFEENRISAIYPPKAPQEGVLGAGDYRIYVGVINAFAEEAAKRFLPHEEERF
jgi:hypothetical protein